jgi:hypothetical protein
MANGMMLEVSSSGCVNAGSISQKKKRLQIVQKIKAALGRRRGQITRNQSHALGLFQFLDRGEC